MSKLIYAFLLFFVFAFAANGFSQPGGNPTYPEMIEIANRLYETRDFETAASAYDQAFSQVRSPFPEHLYYGAKSHALLGNIDRSFELLNAAISAGWNEVRTTLNDPDFFELQKDDRWPETLNRMLEVENKAQEDLSTLLKRELREIDSLDQLYRGQIQSAGDRQGWNTPEIYNLWAKQRLLDSLNVVRISQILEIYGYPDEEVVGDLNLVPLRVVLHNDVQVQEAYLPYFEKAAKADKIPKSYIAELTDLVRIGRGERQLYGTQLIQDPDSGKLRFAPIEDPDNINKRRETYGLEPIEDYAKRFDIKFKAKWYRE
ncbi:MAG: hypothetical protein GYB31_09130 [Bacteroidetes bacterium]|nr:hypothetical protein [Bacteroidota bacterium]